MINPYAHHTVFKKGRGKQMRVYLDESKDILEKYDIDWYRGPENLDGHQIRTIVLKPLKLLETS
ncbi:hypothetical protein BOO23_08325 [Vibrio navarrensis]|nr:hypothetical protein [Vibrio navarrensis]